MPRKGGKEVLARPTISSGHLPVIVLTTSAVDHDVLEMYRLRCSRYIVKPVDFDQFATIIEQFTKYWFTAVVLPRAD